MYNLIFLGNKGSDALNYSDGSGGFILKVNDFQVHIDPGPGILNKAKEAKVNLGNTSCILVSHNHLSHCNDLNLLINLMTFNGLDNRGLLIGDESVIYGSDKERPYLGKKQERFLEKYMVLKEGSRAKVGGLRIYGLKVNHFERGIGFKIKTEHFNLVYTGDTKYYKEMKEEYKDCNLLIANCVKGFDTKSDSNLTADDVVKIVENIKPQMVIITHFGKSMLEQNPIMVAREISKRTGVQVVAARENMNIDPLSYSAALKQKSLEFY